MVIGATRSAIRHSRVPRDSPAEKRRKEREWEEHTANWTGSGHLGWMGMVAFGALMFAAYAGKDDPGGAVQYGWFGWTVMILAFVVSFLVWCCNSASSD